MFITRVSRKEAYNQTSQKWRMLIPMFTEGAGNVCLRLTENCYIQQKVCISRQSLSEASRREVTEGNAIIGQKNILERICGSYETNILYLTHLFNTHCAHETQFLCLIHPFSKSFGVHEIFCAWHNPSVNRMFFMKHALCACYTLSGSIWFSC